jgi:putative ABC transport system permease protein
MGFAERMCLSLIRRFDKTFILFLVIFIVGNLIAGVVAVRQAIIQSEELAKLSLGAYVSIGPDNQALADAYHAGREPTMGVLTTDIIDGLGMRHEVKNYDYSLDAYLKSSHHESYQPDIDYSESMGYAYREGFTVRGVHYANIIPIEEGRLRLASGRTFSEQEIDSGSLVVIISDKLAETNNLHVGDTLILANEVYDYAALESGSNAEMPVPIDSQEVVLEIIGIFALNSTGSVDNYNTGISADNFKQTDLYNTVYVPIKVALAEERFSQDRYASLYDSGEITGSNSFVPYYTPIFTLWSVSDIDGFTKAALEVLPDYYTIISAESQFDQIVDSMKGMERTISTALIMAIVFALIMTSLTVLLLLRDRRREFGIYLSLGIRRLAIVGQALLEMLIVVVFALCLSLFTGNFISDAVSQQLVLDQLTNQQTNHSNVSDSLMIGDVGMMIGTTSLDEVANTYKVTLSWTYVATFFCLEIVIIVVSCIVPMLYLLRLNPKAVLMKE